VVVGDQQTRFGGGTEEEQEVGAALQVEARERKLADAGEVGRGVDGDDVGAIGERASGLAASGAAAALQAGDIEAQIQVALVAGKAQAAQARARFVCAVAGTGVEQLLGLPGGVVSGGEELPLGGMETEQAEALFRIEVVEPQIGAFERLFEVDGEPVVLEPLVHQLENHAPGASGLANAAPQMDEGGGLVLLGLAAVVPAVRMEVRDANRVGQTKLGDDQRIGNAAAQLLQVAEHRVGTDGVASAQVLGVEE